MMCATTGYSTCVRTQRPASRSMVYAKGLSVCTTPDGIGYYLHGVQRALTGGFAPEMISRRTTLIVFSLRDLAGCHPAFALQRIRWGDGY